MQPLHWFLLFIVKINRYRSLRIGKVTFYGPDSFLELCGQATQKLNELDDALFKAVTTQRYVFWYQRERLDHFNLHYSINKSFCDWKEFGIAAFLVYAHHRSRTLNFMDLPVADPSAAVQSFGHDVRQRTRAWLHKHDFPSELVTAYTDTEEESKVPRLNT